MQIRLASLSADADPIWAILEPTIRAAETYTLPADMPRQEALARIDYYEWTMQVTTECIDHLLAFTCAQAAGIDKDTGKLIAHSAMHE